MLYNFEKIIIECLVAKFNADIDDNINPNKLGENFEYRYRRVLDKIISAMVFELIEDENVYKIIKEELTVTERLFILIPSFFDLSLYEVADATYSTYDSVCTQRYKGLKKLREQLENNKK